MKPKTACETMDSEQRSRIGKTVSIIGIACNMVLFLLKFIAGFVSGSLSITADALNNASDATGSVVSLLGFKLSQKPADEHHPYGHARLEYIAGMIVAALILVVGFELGKESIAKMITPEKPLFSPFAIGILIVSVLVKGGMFWLNHRTAVRIGSAVLKATAADSRNDVIITSGVLLAYGLETVLPFSVDGIIGALVALFILYSGIRLIIDIIHPLLGTAGNPSLRHDILQVILGDPHVLGAHDLLMHDYGPSHCYASIHVEMDCDGDPMACHEILDALEQVCLERYGVHLVIHYDPVITEDPQIEQLRTRVQGVLRCFDEALSMHDFRVVRSDGEICLRFDVSLPDRLRDRQEDIRLFLKEAFPDTPTQCVIFSVTFDPDVSG